MSRIPFRFSDTRLCVACARCRKPVRVAYDESFLAMVGHIVKLRCQNTPCSFEDWYLESEFFIGTDFVSGVIARESSENVFQNEERE